jgi:hypothetical protein
MRSLRVTAGVVQPGLMRCWLHLKVLLALNADIGAIGVEICLNAIRCQAFLLE